MRFSGAAVSVGAFFNTDVIFPSEAILLMDAFDRGSEAYAAHLVSFGFRHAGLDREELARSAFLVGGPGLGAGSSRQYAAEALKAYGMLGVIADSMYPIFHRNLWNVGLFALTVAGAGEAIRTGSRLLVDVAAGTVADQTTGRTLTAERVSSRLLRMLAAGGLAELVRAEGGR